MHANACSKYAILWTCKALNMAFGGNSVFIDLFPFLGTKMERGISRVTNNEDLINKARCQVEQDFSSVTLESKSTTETDHPESPPKLNTLECFETPVYTFTLPDITRYPGKVMTKNMYKSKFSDSIGHHSKGMHF